MKNEIKYKGYTLIPALGHGEHNNETWWEIYNDSISSECPFVVEKTLMGCRQWINERIKLF